MNQFERISLQKSFAANQIMKGFADEICKARSGIYADTAENRKLGRVGQKYGSEKVRTDKNGNEIGDGSFHARYEEKKFGEKYDKDISTHVSKSSTTESVYVTYKNKKTGDSVTLRYSQHENNAVKFGEQLNGNTATDDEILYRLGFKKRVFVPFKKLSIQFKQLRKDEMDKYEKADLTFEEMRSLGENADLSKYKGKIAKNSNKLILSDTVKSVEMEGTGKYKYEDK